MQKIFNVFLVFSYPTDCTLQSFLDGPLYDSNFDISDLAASYPGGKQVRVSCSVGYSGFFRLICVEGKWQPRGNKCQRKIQSFTICKKNAICHYEW